MCVVEIETVPRGGSHRAKYTIYVYVYRYLYIYACVYIYIEFSIGICTFKAKIIRQREHSGGGAIGTHICQWLRLDSI